MRKAFTTRSASGLSLIELLMTIVVLSVLFVGILHYYSSSLRATTLSESRSTAKFLAEQEMERLRSLEYTDSDLDAFNSFDGAVQFYENKLYIIKAIVVFIDPSTGDVKEPYPVAQDDDTHLKRITVSAARKDGLGGQVDLVSYLSP